MYALIPSFYFSIAILSVVVFFDVLIKFKKSLLLKTFFLILPFSIGMISSIYALHLNKLVFFIAFFRATSTLSLLNIFCILYFPKYKKWSTGLTIFIVGFSIFFTVLNNGLLGDNPYLYSFRAQSVDSNLNLKVSVLLRTIRFIFLFLICIPMIYFWYVIYTKKDFNNIYYAKVRKWTNWVVAMTIIVLVANVVIQKTPTINKYFWGDVLTIFICYYLLLLILFRPVFLNKSALKIALGHKFNLENEKEIENDDLLQWIEKAQYFKKREASLEGLATLMGVSTSSLSTFIYNNYSMSFNDFINKYRVNYFFEIVRDPAFKNYTIDALAKEAGFSSRQHLNKPFKKFHGGKPSDLLL